MLEKTLNRILCGARTPEGKVVATLLAFVLSFTMWNGGSASSAFADEPASAQASEAAVNVQASAKSATSAKSSKSAASADAEKADEAKSKEADASAAAEEPQQSSAAAAPSTGSSSTASADAGDATRAGQGADAGKQDASGSADKGSTAAAEGANASAAAAASAPATSEGSASNAATSEGSASAPAARTAAASASAASADATSAPASASSASTSSGSAASETSGDAASAAPSSDAADASGAAVAAGEPEASASGESPSASAESAKKGQKVLEGALSASDGSNYKITVTCTESAEIPEGAKLQVKEVSARNEQAYVDGAADALNLADDEFFFYTKFLDIKIMADGREVQPKSQVEVTVKLMDMADADVDARQAENALQVVHFSETKRGPVGQVVEVTDAASKSAGACDVTFQTDGFSVFGIGGIASKLLGWVDDFLNVAVYGIANLRSPSYKAMNVNGIQAGLELLEAYKVTGTGSMWVNVSLAGGVKLGALESVSVFGVQDGALGSELYANMAAGADQMVALGSAEGFALVKDTGLRERTVAESGVKLNGLMPKNATVNVDDAAQSAEVAALQEDSGADAVAAYDISIVNDGAEYQPSGAHPIAVDISDAAIAKADADTLAVWHIAADGSTEQVQDFVVQGDTVSFQAVGFSTYVVTTVLQKTITASDGSSYKVTVAYDRKSGLPEDATLSVEEVAADDEAYVVYLGKSADALALGAEHLCGMKLLDISIVGADGTEYQPTKDVSVSVELLDKQAAAAEDMRVVHFGATAEELASSVDGSTVSFQTDGFSLFSFVDVTLIGQVIQAVIGGGSSGRVLYENDDIVLTGKMPLLGSVEAEPVSVQVNGAEALVAYDIKIYANPLFKALGMCWQPTDGAVQVKLKSAVLADKDMLSVYHMADAASAPELVATVSATDSSVLFDAKSFSIYAIGDEDSSNDRIGYRFWYYNAGAGTYVPITTQYFRYKDVHADPPMAIYEPSIPIITTPEEYQMLFEGWYKAQGTVTEASATLESSSTTIAALNEELQERSQNDFAETDDHTQIVDVVALLKAAYYITYVDTNANNILATDVVPVASSGTTQFTVLKDVMPATYETTLNGWRNPDDPTTLYKEGETYDITSNMTLVPDVEGGHWLIFDDNDLVDDGAGKMVSGGASYTPPAFYMNAPSEEGGVELTVKPADPEWAGYEFGGWYTDAACTDGSEFEFGHALAANTTVYAKWTPAASQYRIVIWKQREGDAADADDADKSYDYVASELVDTGVKTGDVVQLSSLVASYRSNVYCLSDDSVDQTDASYYTYNANLSNQSIVVKADGSSVLNIRYDRKPVTLNFYVYDYTYTATTGTSAYTTYFGYVNGQYVRLTRSGSNPYTWTYVSGTEETYTAYSGTTSGYYYIPDGDGGYERVYLYRFRNRWYTYIDYEYNGTIYQRSVTNVTTTYEGTRYTRGNNQSWQLYKTFTGLYGSTLAENGYTWPAEYDWYSGHTNNGGTSGTRTTLLASFAPIGNDAGKTEINFYGATSSDSSTIRFYLQQLDGSYEKVDEVTASSGNFSISDKYVGFHAAQYSVNGGAWQNVGDKNSDGVYGSAVNYASSLDIRFDRTAYPLTFYTNNGANELIKHYDSSTVLFGQTLEGYADENPGQRTGHYFVGWYADPSLATPFDFSVAMPASSIAVYGSWRMERIRVVLVPGANNVDMGSQALSFRLDYDERISDGLVSSAQRPGYKLEGWYTDPEFTNKFLFSMPVNSSVDGVDMTYQTASKWASARAQYGDDDEAHENVRGILVLYAHWIVDTSVKGTNVQYDPGEAAVYDPMGSLTTTVPIDPNFYQEGATVVVQPAPSGYSDLYNFLYWEAIDKDGTVVKTGLHPSATFTTDEIEPYETVEANGEVIHKTIMLRAKYERSDEVQARYTTITYDGNTFTETMFVGGSQTLQGKTLDGFDNQSVTLDKEVNETIVLPGTESFYLPGYELVGWSFTQGALDEQTKAFDLAQKVAADNLDANELNTRSNTLYAMWKPKTYSVTVKQVVENGVPETSFGYQHEARKNGSDVVAEFANLTGNASFKVDEFGYYNRIGDLFKVSKTEAVPDDAAYAVRVSAKVTKDDGTTETLNPDADGNYWILGDVEITYTYSLKVPVAFAKRDATNHSTELTGAVFQLTPVQYDATTQRWVNAGDGARLEIDAATVTKYLQEGVYRIEETAAPTDYATMSTVLYLTVRKEGGFLLRTQSGGEVNASVAELSGDSATTLMLYDIPIRTVVLKKVVEGGSREGGFDFTVTAYDGDGNPLGKYDLGAGTTSNVGELNFQGMVDGDTKVLKIPHGSKLVIAEETYPHCVTTYTYTWNNVAHSGSTCTIEYVDADGTVTFRNVLTPAPTGVSGDGSPYQALLVIGAMLLVLALPFAGRGRKRSSSLSGFLRTRGGRSA